MYLLEKLNSFWGIMIDLRSKLRWKSLCHNQYYIIILMNIHINFIISNKNSKWFIKKVFIYIIGNKYMQQWSKAIILSSIVDSVVLFFNSNFHNTGKSAKVIMYPVLILTYDGSVGFSWPYIPEKSACGKHSILNINDKGFKTNLFFVVYFKSLTIHFNANSFKCFGSNMYVAQ